MRIIALVAGLLVIIGAVGGLVAHGQTTARVQVRGNHLVDASGTPIFLLGVNYEGPADRAWKMWEDGQYDAKLIAADLTRARAAGFTVVRLFVQQGLADDLQAGRWTKLDEVLRLADQAGIQVILTFGDYSDRRLSNLVTLDTAVATRYKGRATLLAYDLKNEPHFFDLALATYPAGIAVALQDPARVAQLGETIPRESLADYRASDVGQARLPAWLTDDQAYVYANVLATYLQWLDDAQTWAVANDSTTVAYLTDPASANWAPFEEALNDTLTTWLKLQVDALHGADPDALLTVGDSDPVLASLPANNLLDYRTLHRYPGGSSAGVQSALSLFQAVRQALPGKPLVLGEFGFATSEVAEDQAAQLEAELVRGVQAAGGDGALKWMLNDFPTGASPRENSFGVFRGSSLPKPAFTAYRGLVGLRPSTAPTVARPADYDVTNGHFFTQTSGRAPERDPSGYLVSNAEGMPFWDTWQRLGRDTLGYPISRRFIWRGFSTQVFQQTVLQWQPDVGMVPINLFDDLHDGGFDAWLQTQQFVPPPQVPAVEPASWDALVAQRMALLDAQPALRHRYDAATDPLWLYGLPTSAVVDEGDVLAVRTQRAVLLQWKRATPGVAAGDVTVAHGGEIAKALNLFPLSALVPEPAPLP